MKCLALTIGNSNYNINDQVLNFAAKDAQDMANKFRSLQFDVDAGLDKNCEEIHDLIEEFTHKLKEEDYKAGIFYYAGHGVEFKGENYLTGIDNDVNQEYDVTRNAYTIRKLLEKMEESGTIFNILILDCCRSGKFTRGVTDTNDYNLASIKAPQGTFIAFATSPGQTSKENLTQKNGYFTFWVLNQLDKENITIEKLFREVRNSVYSDTRGNQLTWDHSSLTDDFIFNYGQQLYKLDLTYTVDAIKDINYKPDESIDIGKIIKGLKTHVYDTQNYAIRRIDSNLGKGSSDSDLFVLGRSILAAADDDSFDANKLLKQVGYSFYSWLNDFTINGQNHVLNGMLYEVYFNRNNEFRTGSIKKKQLNQLLRMESDITFKTSFEFIANELRAHATKIYYTPGAGNVILNIKFNKINSEHETRFEILSIHFKSKSIYLRQESKKQLESYTYSEFKDMLSKKLYIPVHKLRLEHAESTTVLPVVYIKSTRFILEYPTDDN
ncbi:caspase family protein [Spirosoma pollinicola]|uniref:Caspase family p20 domain-containing protein n=1 Tax=Spirosoma pollinicola TaxID=2057025 RepID=A0A2K8Z686_9BACT|nr:caspase family protein [Spirosoma pollinicola]AUD05406.1 hypothetical protein CWM47_28290 [Spirosoma pollinicola]